MTKIEVIPSEGHHKTKCVKVFSTGYALFVCPECSYTVLIGKQYILLEPGENFMIGHSGAIGGLEITGVEVTQADDSGLANQWFEEAGFKIEGADE